MSHLSQSQIDRKNKMVGISVISVIAVILVAVIIVSSILSSGGVITSSGNLMKGYKINRQTSKLTDSFKTDYLKLATKILKQQVENGGNTAISLTDTATTLSFLAAASNGKTRSQIESLLGGDAISFAASAIYLDNSVKYVKDKKNGLMSSNSVWLNNTTLHGIKKSFLKTNAKHFGLNIQRAGFSEPETSKNARETVVAATNGNSYSNVPFIENELLNVVSGSSFCSTWKKTASVNDIYNSVFMGEKCDYNCDYFRTIESNYLSGNTFSGIAKEFVDDFTFIALVPNFIDEFSRYTINDVMTELEEKNLIKDLYNGSSKTDVAVTLPYYTNSKTAPTSIEFSKALKALGVTSIFDYSADFSGMVENTENLKLDNYYISGDISITPAGTLNTQVDNSVSKKQLDECKVSIEFNRSFIYFIYDNQSRLPIYLGVVNRIE